MDATLTAPIAEIKPAVPTEAEISAALKEYDAATHRVAVIIKYPWLVEIVNNRKPKTK